LGLSEQGGELLEVAEMEARDDQGADEKDREDPPAPAAGLVRDFLLRTRVLGPVRHCWSKHGIANGSIAPFDISWYYFTRPESPAFA
jgi:hypothetical protein